METVETCLDDSKLAVALADGTLRGLLQMLEGLEEELSKDSRYYVLLATLNQIAANVKEADEALERAERAVREMMRRGE